MKWLIACTLLGVTFAAPQYSGYPHLTDILDAFERANVMDETNVNSLDENAESEVIPAALIPLIPVGVEVGYKVLSYIVHCAVCGECTANEQNYLPIAYNYPIGDGYNSYYPSPANNQKHYAKLMAVVEVVENLNVAEQKLNKIQLSMMDNRIAKAELADWISNAIKKLKGAAKFIKRSAKKMLCKKEKNPATS